jgi:hypothetical protein
MVVRPSVIETKRFGTHPTFSGFAPPIVGQDDDANSHAGQIIVGDRACPEPS